MNYLPQDPVMLLSYVNTKLRDEYDSLDEFCNVHDYPKNELTERLDSIGYVYNPELNQFK